MEPVLVVAPKEGDCRGKVDGLWQRERSINGRGSQTQEKHQKKVATNLQVDISYEALDILYVVQPLPLLQRGCGR